MRVRYFVGIDEAGRGALAGPVSVGAVLFPEDFGWKEAFKLLVRDGRRAKLKDSKQLTAQQRDILYTFIVEHGSLKHASAFVEAKAIDEIGIVNACHEAAALAISRLGVSPGKVEVVLDAGLKVPGKWQQESFIRGDETIPAIAFASIIAKVTRDRYMESIAALYPSYGFEENKGYGTLFHRKALAKEGFCDLHRTTFCTRLFGAAPDAEIREALQSEGISV